MILDSLKLIILLPPKTGSSSLRNLFFSYAGGFVRPIFRKLPYPHYHLTLSELMYVHAINKQNLGNYAILQVTRNPFSRFISSWKHQEQILERKIDAQELLDHLLVTKSLLPNAWEEFYQQFYDDSAHQAKSFKKGNWGGLRFFCDQIDWNDLGAKVNYIKLEDLSRDSTELSDFVGKKLPQLEKKNAGHYSSEINLTYSQKSVLYKLFEADFKMLNYEF